MSYNKQQSKKKTRNNSNEKVIYLEDNQKQINSHVLTKTKKRWTRRDLKNILPKTDTQQLMFDVYAAHNHHIIADGFPGTGKTFLSMWLALDSVLTQGSGFEKIIIVRSAVGGRDIGFLPGDQKDKMAPFEIAYKDICNELLGQPTAYQDLVDDGKIEFMSTSFLRSLTWNNSVVIIDEIQNLSWQEIHTTMTRIGLNTRLLVCGDIAQNDLDNKRFDNSGFKNFLSVAEKMPSFYKLKFTQDDIVRSGFVKEWIIAKEELGL